MLDLGWFHLSTTDTVVEGCGRNSEGSAFFEDTSLNERPGVCSVAAVTGCNSIFVCELLSDGGTVLEGVIVTVLVGDMATIFETRTLEIMFRG